MELLIMIDVCKCVFVVIINIVVLYYGYVR